MMHTLNVHIKLVRKEMIKLLNILVRTMWSNEVTHRLVVSAAKNTLNLMMVSEQTV